MLGTLITAGTALLGGALNRKADSDRYDAESARQNQWSERQYEFQDKWNTKQHALQEAGLDLSKQSFDWQKAHIQNRVADAKAAGIHPLYALGAPGAGATFSAGGYGGAPSGPPSMGVGGSGGLGRGIAQAGAAIGARVSAMRKSPLFALQAELLNSQILANYANANNQNAEASYHNSQAAIGAQSLNHTGAGRMLDDGTTVYPLGARRSVHQLETRPMSVSPRTSSPRDAYYVRPDRSKGRKYHEDMQADELNQARILYEDAKWGFTKFLEKHFPRAAPRHRRYSR